MDIQHRFDKGFRPALETLIYKVGDRIFRDEPPEGAEKLKAFKLLDTGIYDELFLIESDFDYFPYLVSVSAKNASGESAEMSFCIFGTGRGDAVSFAYYLVWREGFGCFRVKEIFELEPDTEDCLEYALVQLEPPRDAVYKLLEKLEDRNGLFIAGLIDEIYGMTEAKVLRYEEDELPRRERYIGSPTLPTEDELIKRMRDGIYYDRTAWETNTMDGSALLLDLVDKAQDNEEKKRWLNMFIILPYGTYFLTTAYKTVIEETLPDLWGLRS